MKIAIVGGGFYGCYLAKNLSKNNEIHLFEKNSKLITESGKNNQYRLHLGFHYPRSTKTIQQTKEGYTRFKKEFKNFIYFPKNNYYLIHKKSLVSFDKYCKIFQKKKIVFKKVNLKNIPYLKSIHDYSGAIQTNEGVIMIDKLIKSLRKEVKSNARVKVNTKIDKIDSANGKLYFKNNNFKNFDYIINTTYLNPNLGLTKKKFLKKYEATAMLLPNIKIPNIPAITIMDGGFISMYPRNNNTFSISSVKYTPVIKFKNLKKIDEIKKLTSTKKLQNKIKMNIQKHFNKFLNFKFDLKKTKIEFAFKIKFRNDNNDLRTTNIIKENKLISVFCGKLDTVPLILDEINRKLNL